MFAEQEQSAPPQDVMRKFSLFFFTSSAAPPPREPEITSRFPSVKKLRSNQRAPLPLLHHLLHHLHLLTGGCLGRIWQQDHQRSGRPARRCHHTGTSGTNSSGPRYHRLRVPAGRPTPNTTPTYSTTNNPDKEFTAAGSRT